MKPLLIVSKLSKGSLDLAKGVFFLGVTTIELFWREINVVQFFLFWRKHGLFNIGDGVRILGKKILIFYLKRKEYIFILCDFYLF